MTIRVRRLADNAVIPAYAHPTDAGMDLTAVSKRVDEYGCVVYGTGLAFEIPDGYAGFLFPRSSNSRQDLLLSNCVGVVDSGYRGEVMLKFRRVMKMKKDRRCLGMDYYEDVIAPEDDIRRYMEYEVGERIGQIIILPYPKVTFQVADSLSDSDRGAGGYGSTGR